MIRKRKDRLIISQFKDIMYQKIFFLLLILLLLRTTTERQLKFIQVISRHGVRYPSYPNDYDHSNITTIRNSYNELTIQGKSMHYLLGKQLYQKYWKLLFANTPYQSTYINSLILAKSTNTNRTIESLQSQIMGLLENLQKRNEVKSNAYYFPPFASINENQKILSGKEQQRLSSLLTFPIHVEKGAEGDPKIANLNYQGDFLVKEEPNLCPNQPLWEQYNFQTSFALKNQIQQKLKQAFDMLNNIYHRTDISIRDAYKYIDNYICLKAMGQKYLSEFENPELSESLQFLYVGRLYLNYLYTQQQKKTFSTRLIANTIQNMRKSLEDKQPKIVLYTGHDITLAVLLSSMNFTSFQCITRNFISGTKQQPCYDQYPTFGSNFIFQLWEEDNKQLTISMLINGKSYQIPICNNLQQCRLEEFEKWFENNRVQSPNKQCGVPIQASNKNYLIILIIVFFCGLVTPILYRRLISASITLISPVSHHDTQVSDMIE